MMRESSTDFETTNEIKLDRNALTTPTKMMRRLAFSGYKLTDDVTFQHHHLYLPAWPPLHRVGATKGFYTSMTAMSGFIVAVMAGADLAQDTTFVWIARYESLVYLLFIAYCFVSSYAALKHGGLTPASPELRSKLDDAVWGLRTNSIELAITSLVFYASQHEPPYAGLHVAVIGVVFTFSFLCFVCSSGPIIFEHGLSAPLYTAAYCALLAVFDKTTGQRTYRSLPWDVDDVAALRGSVLLVFGAFVAHLFYFGLGRVQRILSCGFARDSFAPSSRYSTIPQPVV